MPILRYENLTHMELSGLQRDKTVAFVSVGPLEQHGPHLPLGTDAISAAFFAEKLAEKVGESRQDWNFLLFPPLFAGSDTLTYTGSVEVRPSVLRGLLLDCCKQLARDGFRNIVLFGTHGGPRHMVVLEEVAARLRWRHRARAISASATLLYDILHGKMADKLVERMEKSGHPLSKEEAQGLRNDYHGGMLETSVMLAARPDLVRPLFKTLQPALVKSFWSLRRNSGHKVGDGLGHLGSPALARTELGNVAVGLFVDELSPLLERFLDGEKYIEQRFRSRFYFIPFFRTDFLLILVLISYPIITFIAWLVLNRFFTEMIQR